MSLIKPADGDPIPGIKMPGELYWVLKTPAPLAGMQYPRPDFPWKTLPAFGFGGLVSLEPGCYDHAPLSLLFSKLLEDLHHGGDPQNAQKEQALIAEAVEAVVTALQAGQGVVVHCAGGTGRTGTVIGCVLRRLGYNAAEVVSYLDALHKARGRRGWPESPWQKTVVDHCDV
jgi:hypothetical protein